MEQSTRLNGVIKALESGTPAFVTFAQGDVTTAVSLAEAPYDGVVFEMEHGPFDTRTLRDCLQYMLNRRQIVRSGTLETYKAKPDFVSEHDHHVPKKKNGDRSEVMSRITLRAARLPEKPKRAGSNTPESASSAKT